MTQQQTSDLDYPRWLFKVDEILDYVTGGLTSEDLPSGECHNLFKAGWTSEEAAERVLLESDFPTSERRCEGDG